MHCKDGYAVEGYSNSYSSGSHFILNRVIYLIIKKLPSIYFFIQLKVDADKVKNAMELADLSRKIYSIQSNYTLSHQMTLKERYHNNH